MSYTNEKIVELANLILQEGTAEPFEKKTLKEFVAAFAENPHFISESKRIIAGSTIINIEKRQHAQAMPQGEEEPTRMTVRLSRRAVEAISRYQEKYNVSTGNKALSEILEYYWREKEGTEKMREDAQRTKKELDSLKYDLIAFKRLLKTIEVM